MSILDSISKDSENIDVDKSGIDFKSIIDLRDENGEGSSYLCSLGDNTTQTLTSSDKEGNAFSLDFRMLTAMEEIKMHTFVNNLKSILPVKIDVGHQHLSDLILGSIVKLMMATTPRMSSSATLINYNSISKLSIADLLDAKTETISLVLKEYESLENKFNPKINNLTKEEIQKMVEWVKKPETPLSVLTYEQSLMALDYLLEQKELQDNL